MDFWKVYRFEFDFASVHMNTSKELTEYRSEIFNRNEISYRFEFILSLMWTYSNSLKLEYVHMRGEMNSNRHEISFRLKISLRCSVSSLLVFTWIEAKWTAKRYGFHIGHFDRNEISFRVIKYHVNTTRNEMPTHVHQNIRSFWNSVKTKFHVNRTCFHAGLWNLKTVWVHFASRVNALLVIYPKCDISSLLAEVVSKHDRYKS